MWMIVLILLLIITQYTIECLKERNFIKNILIKGYKFTLWSTDKIEVIEYDKQKDIVRVYYNGVEQKWTLHKFIFYYHEKDRD